MTNNQSGFSLLQVLISLALLSVMLTSLPIIILTLPKSPDSSVSVDQFYYYLNTEVQKASEVSSGDRRITLTYDNDLTVTYELYQNIIRRQVNRTGHEVYLYHVETFQLEEKEEVIHVSTTLETGEVYEKILPITN